jgi:hypothetical protein
VFGRTVFCLAVEIDGDDGPRSAICWAEEANVSGDSICHDVGHSDIPVGLSVEKIHVVYPSLCTPVNHHTVVPPCGHPSHDPDSALWHVVRDHSTPAHRQRDAALHHHYVDPRSPDLPAVSWHRRRLRPRRGTASVSAVRRIETHLPWVRRLASVS